jgi:hypothetical protein
MDHLDNPDNVMIAGRISQGITERRFHPNITDQTAS